MAEADPVKPAPSADEEAEPEGATETPDAEADETPEQGVADGKRPPRQDRKSKPKQDPEEKFTLLDGKQYKAELEEVLKTTSVKITDLDERALALLDTYQTRGKAKVAIERVKEAVQGLSRNEVSNWRGYVYTLLKCVDVQAYQAMKDSMDISKIARGTGRPRVDSQPTRGGRAARHEQRVSEVQKRSKFPVMRKDFNPQATEFVPGSDQHTASLRRASAESSAMPWWCPCRHRAPPQQSMVPAAMPARAASAAVASPSPAAASRAAPPETAAPTQTAESVPVVAPPASTEAALDKDAQPTAEAEAPQSTEPEASPEVAPEPVLAPTMMPWGPFGMSWPWMGPGWGKGDTGGATASDWWKGKEGGKGGGAAGWGWNGKKTRSAYSAAASSWESTPSQWASKAWASRDT